MVQRPPSITSSIASGVSVRRVTRKTSRRSDKPEGHRRATVCREVCSELNSIQVGTANGFGETGRCSLGYKLVLNQGKNVVSNTRFTNAPTSGSLLTRGYDTFDAYRQSSCRGSIPSPATTRKPLWSGLDKGSAGRSRKDVDPSRNAKKRLERGLNFHRNFGG